METNSRKKAFRGFTAITVIVSLLGLGNSAYIIFNEHAVSPIVSNVFSALALLGALTYVFRGGRKSEAGFFRGFMLFLALTELVNIFAGVYSLQSMMVGGRLALTVTILALGFGIYCILGFAKDFGQGASFFCGGLALFLFILLFVIDLIGEAGSGTPAMLRGGANVALAFVAIYLISAKYKDKTARGTK